MQISGSLTDVLLYQHKQQKHDWLKQSYYTESYRAIKQADGLETPPTEFKSQTQNTNKGGHKSC